MQALLLRVLADRFRPDRSQRRARKTNEGNVRLEIGSPIVTRAKLTLYDRYHAYQTAARGWPEHPAKDAAGYANSFVDNPFPTQEWCYYLGDRLVGSRPREEGAPGVFVTERLSTVDEPGPLKMRVQLEMYGMVGSFN